MATSGATTDTLHPRAFKVTVVWTLTLLLLGSVVHATESSLACPDWPTCFGTMAPEMSGGVFWEHLHRLVAGGLVLMFGLATWLARRERGKRSTIYRAGLAGLGLLVVQSVFGGLTVIYRLPDLVSTSHLALAFLFLSLASALAAATHGAGSTRREGTFAEDWQASSSSSGPRAPSTRSMSGLAGLAGVAASLVFVQSVVGGLVRHTDGGMSCPDVPLCLGQIVPPLVNIQITSHFLHRVLALLVTAAVVALAVRAHRSDVPEQVRGWTRLAVGLVLVQIGLGVVSVLSVLAVVPVSLHTLVAACLLSVLVVIGTLSARQTVGDPVSEPASV